MLFGGYIPTEHATFIFKVKGTLKKEASKSLKCLHPVLNLDHNAILIDVYSIPVVKILQFKPQ
jgi:hypothetical protein